MPDLSPSDLPVLDKIQELIVLMGREPSTYQTELVSQLIQTSLKLLGDDINLGQLKLITRALKEMRYAYKTFGQYPDALRVSIFGSARTPENHPDFKAAARFSKEMAEAGWMCMTGAANGIMKAGLEGAHQDKRFGLTIRLPFETVTNLHIENDPKLVVFRYFFTRKLMFVSHSDAFAAFPGGYGTMDELFEVLTLMQTGKSEIVPLVLIEGADRKYWDEWENYVKQHLLDNGWISEEDLQLYYRAPTVEEAVKHILHFYSLYHSSRYVKDRLVIRLNRKLDSAKIDELNETFSDLIEEGKIETCDPFPEEEDHLDKPRIAFIHNRKYFGRLRALINAING